MNTSAIAALILASLWGLLGTAQAVFAQSSASERVVVETPLGPVAGLKGPKVNLFLGLNYAKSPAGDLRFSPPQPVEKWIDPVEAVSYGPICTQVPSYFVQMGGVDPQQSEDCLNLNIYAPEEAKAGSDLPVYVFIHGGGFGLGAGSQPLYDGSKLASQGIVVVTLNYRLGPLGFFSSEETLKKYGTTGNWGILDQIEALRWVHNNISAFGGDPSKVTIGGESAGAVSVSSLIISPRAKGLFRGAIMESGTFYLTLNFPFTRGDLALSQAVGKIMVSLFDKDYAQGLSKLKEAAPDVLAALSPFEPNLTRASFLGLTPVFDGEVIPVDPQMVLAVDPSQKVNILIGYNGDEGSLFIPPGETPAAYQGALAAIMGLSAAEAYTKRFPINQGNNLVERTRQAVAYTLFSSGSKRFADVYSRWANVYLYKFEYEPPLAKKNGLGSSHAAELNYVFGTLPVKSRREEKILSQELIQRWVNFIKTGDPNDGPKAPSEVTWPRYDPAHPELIRFNTSVSVGPIPAEADMEFVAQSLFGPIPRPKRN
jgi:para-nitrobenzyl esterase